LLFARAHAAEWASAGSPKESNNWHETCIKVRVEIMKRVFEKMSEMELTACVAAAAVLALILMLGHAIWTSLPMRGN